MTQTHTEIYAICNGSKISSSNSFINTTKYNQHTGPTNNFNPSEKSLKPISKVPMLSGKQMRIKECLNIFFHKDIVEFILNYIPDIKVSTSGISPNLRSNDENFIDMTKHNLEEHDEYWR